MVIEMHSVDSIAAALATTVLLLAIGTLWLFRQAFLQRKASRDVLQTGNDCTTTFVRLLDGEDFLLMTGGRLITTLTWFKGDHEAAATFLKQRLTVIVEANPWLTGRIVQRNFANFLAYRHHTHNTQHNATVSCTNKKADAVDNADAADLFFHLSPPDDSPLARHDPVESLASIAKRHGLTLKQGWNQPVYRVSVVPSRESPDTHFCVVVCMSHIVGDGHTFYSLYDALMMGSSSSCCAAAAAAAEEENAPTAVPTLCVTRVATSKHQLADFMGKQEATLLFSLGILIPSAFALIFGKIWGIFCPKYRVQQRYFMVDNDKLNQIKETASKKDATVEYCSSNDVITSWFFSNFKCRYGFMAVNLRGRLDGHSEQHAGNYIGMVCYRNPEDCSSPGLIRRSIATMKRAETASLTFPLLLVGGTLILTNWANFPADTVNLPGCHEELHCPLIAELYAHPANLVGGIIFRPRPNQTAILILGSPSKVDDGMGECPFAGPAVA